VFVVTIAVPNDEVPVYFIQDTPVNGIFNLKTVDVNMMIEPAPEPSLILESKSKK
jgi:hypothetical protein